MARCKNVGLIFVVYVNSVANSRIPICENAFMIVMKCFFIESSFLIKGKQKNINNVR